MLIASIAQNDCGLSTALLRRVWGPRTRKASEARRDALRAGANAFRYIAGTGEALRACQPALDGAENGHRLAELGQEASAKSYTDNIRINVGDNGDFSVELAVRVANLFHRIYFTQMIMGI
jgi:hypothetical protein